MGFKDKDGNGVGWKDALQFFDISPARELPDPLPMRMTAPPAPPAPESTRIYGGNFASGQPLPVSYLANTAEPSPGVAGVAGGDVAADPFIGRTVFKTFPDYGKEPFEGRVEKAVEPGKYLVLFERYVTMTSKELVALGLGSPAPPVPDSAPDRSAAPPVDAAMERMYDQVLALTPDEIHQLPAVQLVPVRKARTVVRLPDSQGTKRSMRESEERPSKKTRDGDTYVVKECAHRVVTCARLLSAGCKVTVRGGA